MRMSVHVPEEFRLKSGSGCVSFYLSVFKYTLANNFPVDYFNWQIEQDGLNTDEDNLP